LSVARNLEIPWSLAFLPSGGIVFTERPGRVRFIDVPGNQPSQAFTLPDVAPRGEGGLLGIALHPDFASNQQIYLYHTYESGGYLLNRIVRFRFAGGSLAEPKPIIDGIPGAQIHDGGRLKFGPDGMLYITTGDAGVAGRAQDRNSLAGKILRLRDDGSIPLDNPFPNSPIYTYGHRNPEGLAWDEKGQLWATEHGSSATDEVNLIVAGRNYGWPVIRGDQQSPGMESPYIHSGSDTWAPSGAAVFQGALFFTGLRGSALFELPMNDSPILRRHLPGQFGRLRDVVPGQDGFLYVLTSNRDGRGAPTALDDQIIRIDPKRLP